MMRTKRSVQAGLLDESPRPQTDAHLAFTRDGDGMALAAAWELQRSGRLNTVEWVVNTSSSTSGNALDFESGIDGKVGRCTSAASAKRSCSKGVIRYCAPPSTVASAHRRWLPVKRLRRSSRDRRLFSRELSRESWPAWEAMPITFAGCGGTPRQNR